MKGFISESSNAARLLSRFLFVGVSKMDGVALWTICLGLVWNGSKHTYVVDPCWSMLIQQSNSPTSGVFQRTRSLKFQHVSADQVTNSKECQGRRSWCLPDGFETTSSSKVFTRPFQHEPHLPNSHQVSHLFSYRPAMFAGTACQLAGLGCGTNQRPG